MNVLILMVVGVAAVTAAPGTTPNIQQIFVGRCLDYDQFKYKDILPRVSATCTNIWNSFLNAFSYKDPCKLTQSDYQPFITMVKQVLPRDKVLFWSGHYQLAHDLGHEGQRLITLEDTLMGYLANSLSWCGQLTSPGINYTACPDWSACPLEASESFWAAASTAFAKAAKGDVYLMLDGSSTRAAYRQSSFFGKYELPNLNVKEVTAVNVMVIHELGKPKNESCGQGSLITLQNDVTKRGLKYVCENDPDEVMHLMCADSVTSTECRLAARSQGNQPSQQDQYEIPSSQPRDNDQDDLRNRW